MTTNQQQIQKALKRLTKEGVIQPIDVVESAKNPKSPLHQLFTWDDTKAAHEYRLHQARQILRTYVVIEDTTEKQTVRAFVSLRSDRAKAGGGYRHVADVMSDAELYAQLLEDSFAEMRSFQTKYARIKELRPVFDAADAVAAKYEQVQTPQAA